MISKAWQMVVVALTLAGAKFNSFLDGRLDAVGRGKLMAEAVAGPPTANRGQTSVEGIVRVVIGLAVGGLVAAFILPIAIEELTAVDTANWSSGAQSLWNILDVVIVLVVFLIFIFLAMRRSGRM